MTVSAPTPAAPLVRPPTRARADDGLPLAAPTAALVPPPTASVYERIKVMAETYRIKPGARVNEVELARTLGVSRTPVREALNRIAAEGFLLALPNKGYCGRAFEAQQILELYEYRSIVETGVVALVCERASDSELSALAELTDAHRDEPDTDAQALRLLVRDEEFHERLAVLARNEECLRSVRSLNERLRFARWLDLKTRRSLTRNDHPDIVAALLRRDSTGVQSMMRRHISHHLEHLVALTRAGYADIYMDNALADFFDSSSHLPASPTNKGARSHFPLPLTQGNP